MSDTSSTAEETMSSCATKSPNQSGQSGSQSSESDLSVGDNAEITVQSTQQRNCKALAQAQPCIEQCCSTNCQSGFNKSKTFMPTPKPNSNAINNPILLAGQILWRGYRLERTIRRVPDGKPGNNVYLISRESEKKSRDKHALKFVKETVCNQLRRLDHTNIVPIIDSFSLGDGVYAGCIQPVQRCSLAELLDSSDPPALPEVWALNIFRQVQQGLEYLHNVQLAHRAIRLEHILLCRGKAMICGLGSVFGSSAVTCANVPPGTQVDPFLAPEVLALEESPKQQRSRNQSVKTGTSKQSKQFNPFMADVYSLGMVLYMTLFAFCPFKPEDLANAEAAVAAKSRLIKFPDWPPVTKQTREIIKDMMVTAKYRPKVSHLKYYDCFKQPFVPGTLFGRFLRLRPKMHSARSTTSSLNSVDSSEPFAPSGSQEEFPDIDGSDSS